MRVAYRPAAARAFSDLVHAHRLVRAALTVLEARRAQAPASLRRIRPALLRMPVAHDPAAAAARPEAGRAGGVPVLGAPALVRRAIVQGARSADAHVLVTCRLLVHATVCNAVLRAEILAANRALRRARLTAAVVAPADHEARRRPTTMRAGHDPGGGTAQRPLCVERCVTPMRRLELPLGALHQNGRVDELQGMHDGLHLAAPRTTTRATSRPTGCRATRAVLSLHVPFRTGIGRGTSLSSALSLRERGTGDEDGAIRPSDRRAARVRIASISCDTNGLPSTAISASGARSSAASENATLKRSRSLKNARSPWGKVNLE